MTIRLSAMFEDRVDSVLRDWYESASGGARRTRLRTMRLLGSQAPDSSGDRVPRHRGSHSETQAAAAHSSGVGSSSDSLSARESRTRSMATRAAVTSDSEQRNGYGHAVTSRTETRGSSRVIPQSHHDRDNDNVFDDAESGRQTRSTRASARRELVMRFPASRSQDDTQEESVSNGPLTSRYSTRRSTSLAQESASVNGEGSDEEEEGEEEEEEEEGEEGSEQGEEQGDESEGEEEEQDEEEDEDEDDEDEDEESDDSAVESRHQTRRKTARPTHRPTVTVRTTKRSANTNNTRSDRRKSNASSSRRTSETSQRNVDNPAPSRRSMRRNSSARRVRYNENDSDSESDSLGNEVIGVSSRGRVRKPAIRMQDYVE